MLHPVRSLFLMALLAGAAHAQGGKYTPLPAGERDPEALKKLSAMLGGGGQPAIDPKMMDIVRKWLKDTENDPEARKRIIDAARKTIEDNPQQFQNDTKKVSPDLSDGDVKKLMQGLGKPGDPPPVLPKPGDRPAPVMPRAQDADPTPIPPNWNGPPGRLPPYRSAQPNPDSEQVKDAMQRWEQTFGPLESTPAVRDAIVDLFGHGAGGPNEKPLWDGSDFTGGSSPQSPDSAFWKSLTGGTGGSNWTVPGWLKNLNVGNVSTPSAPRPNLSGPSAPSLGGMGSFGGIGVAGLGGAGTPIAALIAIAVFGFLIWKYLPMIRKARARRLRPLPGQGPWPVDPRSIRDRESLVAAFEYLSVLVCGSGAVVWNHMTIAEALRGALPDLEHLAGPLARLYAIARYTPLGEEVPDGSYAEARRCLCALAGVSAV